MDDSKPKQRDKDGRPQNFRIPPILASFGSRQRFARGCAYYYVDLTGQRGIKISVWNDIDLCHSYLQLLFHLQQEWPVSDEEEEPEAMWNCSGGEGDRSGLE